MNPYRSTRLWGRKKFDSGFCKRWAGIESFGGINSWNIFTRHLDKNSIIYSAGVGRDISFEKAVVSRFKVNIELFDPSPTGIATMELAENNISNIHFTPVGIAGKSAIARFSPPENELEGSFTVALKSDLFVEFQCKDLSRLMEERGHLSIDLLKLDIEGFEYEVIDDIINKSIDIRQICVEFHHFINGIKICETLKAIANLRAAGYMMIYKTRFDYTFYRKPYSL